MLKAILLINALLIVRWEFHYWHNLTSFTYSLGSIQEFFGQISYPRPLRLWSIYMQENKLIIAPIIANRVNKLASLLFIAGTLFFMVHKNAKYEK
jgi:hypothetical protein